MTKTLPITQARDQLTMLVNNVSKKLDEYVITVNGSPSAVLMSAAQFDSWKETDEILADKVLMKSIKRGQADLKKGKFITLDQLKKDLKFNV